MKSDAKPVIVTLKGKTTENPEQPLVKVSDELDDAALDDVSGGVGFGEIVITKQIDKASPQIATAPGGVGSFHPGAWAT